MKKKKLYKIVQLTVEELRGPTVGKTSESYNDRDISEYDPTISDKFRKMVENILNYRENININIDENRILISCENAKNLKSKSMTYNDDNFLEMTITKNLGFNINYGYRKRSNYKDEKIYDELLESVISRIKKENFKNFENLWTQIMTDSGLLRDHNLENLLED
jgi:hypothetical protein